MVEAYRVILLPETLTRIPVQRPEGPKARRVPVCKMPESPSTTPEVIQELEWEQVV